MKKIRLGSVEVLGLMGLMGLVIWGAVVLLRAVAPPTGAAARFWLGSLPNLGAAWGATMFAKWVLVRGFKQKYTSIMHFLVCAAILLLALGSEIVHDVFLGSPFDPYDMLFTGIAQLLMAFLPILLRDGEIAK